MTKQVRAGREGNGPFDSAQGPGRGSARHVCRSDGPALDSFGYFRIKTKSQPMARFDEVKGTKQRSGWLRSSP